MTAPYPLSALRAVALHSQGLATPPGQEPSPTPAAILAAIKQIGCVQIDTLQMVQRSHYLTLWSRLGNYDPADFDRLIYAPAAENGANNRQLFEYWLHAACIVPLDSYRWLLPKMRYYREDPTNWNMRWLAKAGNRELVERALARIRTEGGLRSGDFKENNQKGSTWWDWKPAKRALEVLFDWGDLMIADRVNFQRVYDLRERVLPGWVDTREPSPEEADRALLEQGIRAFGVCEARQASGYAYHKVAQARPHIDAMLDDGTVHKIKGETADGSHKTFILHRDNLPLLEQAADGALTPARTTFLSPFDSLFWAKGRDMQFLNFRQVLEAYKPAAKREWGYFCLPILHRDRLVGRFDPKLERKTGTLRLKALYLEPGIAPDEGLIHDVAAAMRDFLAFHSADTLVIERSDPPEFGEKLLAAL